MENVQIFWVREIGMIIGALKVDDGEKVTIENPFFFDVDDEGDTVIRKLLTLCREQAITVYKRNFVALPVNPTESLLETYTRVQQKAPEKKKGPKKDPSGTVVLFDRDRSN